MHTHCVWAPSPSLSVVSMHLFSRPCFDSDAVAYYTTMKCTVGDPGSQVLVLGQPHQPSPTQEKGSRRPDLTDG